MTVAVDERPTSVLLAPHNDDETLFAAFSILRHRPRVVVVLRSDVQERRGTGIVAAERELETTCACALLGVPWEQWPFLDSDPPWAAIAVRVGRLANTYSTVFAPAVEEGGHEQHSEIGRIAQRAFAGGGRVVSYATYVRGQERTRTDHEVEPDDPAWIGVKLRALSCYESQMREPSCRPWFLGDQREYLIEAPR